MRLTHLPFHIGATNQAVNPGGLPNTYPFKLGFDSDRVMLVQQTNNQLEKVLREAYEVGQAFGTPLAEDQFGKPYAEDFLSFIQLTKHMSMRGLEIGAGVGYLTRRLIDLGWNMTTLEPGIGYEPFWSKYEIDVIQEFFPSPAAPGPYNLCVAYGVLEHVPDPFTFLKAIRSHLAPDGVAVFSVPDCTDEIASGDPSFLLHEHISYFDAGSLTRLIQSVGMNVVVKKSGYGRCLYAIASLNQQYIGVGGGGGERGLAPEVIESYPERCIKYIERVRRELVGMTAHGTLGIYCAARGLALLDPEWPVRFFDDDPSQQEKFLPPFKAVIEGRDDLFATPVDNLVILSRTFGHRIRDSLREQGYGGSIITLDEI